MQETRVQSLGLEDLLEWEAAPHSSILAWKIPWSEKPGRLQSTGPERARFAWATEHTHKEAHVDLLPAELGVADSCTGVLGKQPSLR